jgi:glycosyltransferase involved in cell wall biosynthesis
LDAGAFLAFVPREPRVDFCFVNDGSTDATLELLGRLHEQAPGRITFLHLERNHGKAGAVRAGVLHVAGDHDAVGFMDADLATPLEEMLRLVGIREGEEAPAVIGSRVKRLGVTVDRTAFRHYAGRLFATVVSLLFRLNAYDTQCGAKLFEAGVAREIFREPFLSTWLFDVELLLRLRRLPGEPLQRARVVPLDAWYERSGSKIKPSYLFCVPVELFKIWREYRGR